ncbi:putative F-box protein At1g47765 [Triticum urartu]|uniref:putative F-box protein At1g47765 n=1 Tax=Triticum urartu TaxID=4572 RepID=UPI002043041F|nr:putative F-box protein At1g47765 [Triticum urartu]
MSSSKLRPSASRSDDLPADALYEILLRIPAKELCRLRTVSPSWRALTFDPLFITAHKSRHHTAPPLLAIAYCDDSGTNGVAISDISGNVLKRIPSTGYEIVLVNESSGDPVSQISSKGDSIRVVRTRLDLVCFNWIFYSRDLWVLNPATGSTITLPTDFSEELVHELQVEGIKEWHCKVESCAFGQVSSTREYKALRVSTIGDRKVCEIITFNEMNHGRWRRKQDPRSHICTGREIRCVVVNGVVYFLMDFYSTYFETGVITIESGSVASFNLETEEWGVLHGPQQVQRFVQENEDYSYSKLEIELSLAELNGCLVMVHNIHNISMDLWFLTDFEKCIWVKKYSMPSHVARPCMYPFLMLDDGRIFFSAEGYLQGILGSGEPGDGFLRSYDPRMDTFLDSLELGDSKSIGIYTGSLLSL